MIKAPGSGEQRILAMVITVAASIAAMAHVGCGGVPVTIADPKPAGDRGSPPTRVVSPLTPATPSASDEPPWFTQVTDSGISFVHATGTSPEKPFPAANGSGLAALDYDLDGAYDLYFATGTPIPVKPTPDSPRNRMYRSLGDWKFEEVTDFCGLGHNGYSAGLAVGDYDGDGFPDVYIGCYGLNCLFHNQGDGTFRRVEVEAKVADPRWATSTAFLDFDGDGLLDLYVCNYGEWSLATNSYCGDPGRKIRHYCSPTSVPAIADALYRNLGNGSFDDVASKVGLGRAGRAQGVIAVDMNDDGWMDLYLGNDMNENSYFVNDGKGGFLDETNSSGVGFDHLGRRQAGMGVDAADIDRDGRMDLFVTNFAQEHNAFYRQTGENMFVDVSHAKGLATASIPWVGWGTVFSDFNLDGWPDVVVTNGHVDDNKHLMGLHEPYQAPPLLWRNEKGRFHFLGATGGKFFSGSYVGRALVACDLDNDGDTDLAIGHQDGPPALLKNERVSATDSAPSVTLQLIGVDSNRDAIGASVTLKTKDGDLTQQIKGGGSYLSAHDRRKIFATTVDQQDLVCQIRWPNRSVSTFNVQPGGSYAIVEPRDADSPPLVIVKEQLQ